MKRRMLRPAFVLTTALAAECLAGADASAQTPPRNSPRCPRVAPAAGGACARPRLECGYRPCGNYFTQRFTCAPQTRRWTFVEVTCNPPPPPPPPPMIRPPGNPPPPPPEDLGMHRNPPMILPR
jgi:hypothetical protein